VLANTATLVAEPTLIVIGPLVLGIATLLRPLTINEPEDATIPES
jgi:hypothetical protein